MIFQPNTLIAIIALQLLHPSTCSPNDLDSQILELKIKAKNSVELSSTSFNELPSLFYLYKSLITKRFESVHKNDPKKFEEFRKIHQYHAIRTLFHSLELRDVIMFDMNFNAENLDIIKNKVNWTDNEVMMYKILGMDEHGNLKFNKKYFADFFVAQYFLDNIVHPETKHLSIDNTKSIPSDEEMELRLRFFLHTVIHKTLRNPILNEFIMSMIEDQNGEIFSNQVRMVMKYKFRSLLDTWSCDEMFEIEKISTIFRKDKEILGSLWRIDQNRPFFLEFLKCTSLNVKELKSVVEKFFKLGSENEFLYNQVDSMVRNESQSKFNLNLIDKNKIFRGQDQLLNILELIYIHNNENFTNDILEVTQYEVSDEILTKLEKSCDFSDFVDSENFSSADIREYYLENAYNQITLAETCEDLMKFWNKIQNYFNQSDLKEILIQKDHSNQSHLYYLSLVNQDVGECFLNLTRMYLNKEEIKQFLDQRHPITRKSFIANYLSQDDDEGFVRICWNFAKSYLNAEELRKLIFDNTEPYVIEEDEKYSFLLNFD